MSDKALLDGAAEELDNPAEATAARNDPYESARFVDGCKNWLPAIRALKHRNGRIVWSVIDGVFGGGR